METYKDTIKHGLQQDKDDKWSTQVAGTLAIVADLPGCGHAIYHSKVDVGIL